MYILSIIVLMVSVFFMAAAGESGIYGVSHFFDIVSILLVVIVFITMMAAAGLLKDFNNAFKLTIGKKDAESILELKRARESVKFAGKLFILSGLLGTIMGIIMIAYSCKNFNSVMVNMGVALLTMFYGLVLYILLLPVQARIEVKISEFMQI